MTALMSVRVSDTLESTAILADNFGTGPSYMYHSRDATTRWIKTRHLSRKLYSIG